MAFTQGSAGRRVEVENRSAGRIQTRINQRSAGAPSRRLRSGEPSRLFYLLPATIVAAWIICGALLIWGSV